MGRNIRHSGQFQPGGDPRSTATQFKDGHAAAGPGRSQSKLRAEYESFKDRLFDPEIKEKAWGCLQKAIGKGEVWAVSRYFDMVQKVLPQTPIEMNVTADLTVAKKEQDDAIEFITRELARYAASRGTETHTVEAESGKPQIPVALLGTSGTTGTER